jgi:hypothetical protein
MDEPDLGLLCVVCNVTSVYSVYVHVYVCCSASFIGSVYKYCEGHGGLFGSVDKFFEGHGGRLRIRWYMDCGYHGVQQEVTTVVLPSNNRKINRRE